jgi:hypothetical protein
MESIMTITMTTTLPNHCVTATASFESINEIGSKYDCLKLIRDLSFHAKRQTSSGRRFSALKRADQRKVVKLLKKHSKVLTEDSMDLVLSDESLKSDKTRFYGYLNTPNRGSMAKPSPGYHVSISVRSNDSISFLDITCSKDNGTYHDLIHTDVFTACKGSSALNCAFKNASKFMNSLGINLIYAT